LLGNITERQSVGYSHYKSLGVKFTRRYSQGLTVLSSYTLSKSTDNGSGIAQGVPRPAGVEVLERAATGRRAQLGD